VADLCIFVPLMASDAERGRFATTRWTVVLAAARQGADAGAAGALATLCGTYWYPVYAFVRRRGYGPEDAQDLTQAFFARVLEKGAVGAADPSRGRFRSFLLTGVQNFLANEHAKARAQKRGGGLPPAVPLDAAAAESRYAVEPAHELTPERLFDRRWATTQLELGLGELRGEYAKRNAAHVFARLQPFLGGDVPGGSYAPAAAELGMSESAVKVAVHRLRQRYRELLRKQILQTVTSRDEVDDEVRHLFAALAG
jgi:DNA-directed RNA polymerase specialized sigma24 family protein